MSRNMSIEMEPIGFVQTDAEKKFPGIGVFRMRRGH